VAWETAATFRLDVDIVYFTFLQFKGFAGQIKSVKRQRSKSSTFTIISGYNISPKVLWQDDHKNTSSWSDSAAAMQHRVQCSSCWPTHGREPCHPWPTIIANGQADLIECGILVPQRCTMRMNERTYSTATGKIPICTWHFRLQTARQLTICSQGRHLGGWIPKVLWFHFSLSESCVNDWRQMFDFNCVNCTKFNQLTFRKIIQIFATEC